MTSSWVIARLAITMKMTLTTTDELTASATRRARSFHASQR